MEREEDWAMRRDASMTKSPKRHRKSESELAGVTSANKEVPFNGNRAAEVPLSLAATGKYNLT
jgi:hypothetical protein